MKKAASVTLVTELTGTFPNSGPSLYYADLWLHVTLICTISASNHLSVCNLLENKVQEIILNAHEQLKKLFELIKQQ